MEPRVKVDLLTESSYFNFIETWSDGKSYYKNSEIYQKHFPKVYYEPNET